MTTSYDLISCNECKGTGSMQSPILDEECCHCDGSGRVCENCEGYSIEHTDPDGFMFYHCPKCGTP